MGRRPWCCYRVSKGKPYPKSRYNRGVPDPKIRSYDIGNKRALYDFLPICVNLISKEKEQISSESLEAGKFYYFNIKLVLPQINICPITLKRKISI